MKPEPKNMKFTNSHDLANHLLSQPNLPIRVHAVDKYCEDGHTLAVAASEVTLYDNDDMENPRQGIVIDGAMDYNSPENA